MGVAARRGPTDPPVRFCSWIRVCSLSRFNCPRVPRSSVPMRPSRRSSGSLLKRRACVAERQDVIAKIPQGSAKLCNSPYRGSVSPLSSPKKEPRITNDLSEMDDIIDVQCREERQAIHAERPPHDAREG